MSFSGDRLFKLLPAIHRIRDADPSNPSHGALKELLHIISTQFEVLEEELQQLYENHFVETAEPWALPYIGELTGVTGTAGTGQTKALAPRAEIANTIGYRRRKGTAAVLEQLAHDVMDQPAAAVEFFQRIITTQHLNHLRLLRTDDSGSTGAEDNPLAPLQPAARNRPATVSLRSALALEFTGTPFETAARTVEVRRIATAGGRWNIPNTGLFLWRLHASARTKSPAAAAAAIAGGRHFYLHPLGVNSALCANPETKTEITHLAGPADVPVLLSRRLFAGAAAAAHPGQFHPSREWYGRSVQLYRETAAGNLSFAEVEAEEIIVADLSDTTAPPPAGSPPGTPGTPRWMHDTFAGNLILLDPVLGRAVFPLAPAGAVLATFHTLRALDIGGGEYARTVTAEPASPVVTVSQQSADPGVVPAVDGHLPASGDFRMVITDSGCYAAPAAINAAGRKTAVTAIEGKWPVLKLSADMELSGSGGTVILDGLQLSGGGLVIKDGLSAVKLRHCTLPGGLRVLASAGSVELTMEDCIVTGRLRLPRNAVLRLKNCIVDGGAPDAVTIALDDAGAAAAALRMEECTIIGRVHVRSMELVSNCILLSSEVTSEERQQGCVRFSWLPPGARVPRRHQCLPADEDGKRGVRPYFVSLTHGHPGYGQLSLLTPDAIRSGASDEGEMGAGHSRYESRREAHLRVRLEEYLRFGLEAGLLHQP